ncbi:thiamine pyrophosphate-binding protein [Afifella sp. IM 167]|uniref:thiamine pyrophosphate-binding protein n=1 Tax=Afifella sp. IM 167 TaxID=2033586 RepID=UPI001CC9019D|nr:thiamine pyrophosphate-binding protein [Afifella sp. IM 167]MBZ8135031.1 thiamine pyrophosphate-binding protein [Afifella sp. IM 167]
MRTGGQILIDQLLAQGVKAISCVPGESYLAALDALHGSKIDVVTCRNEGGAAMMAEAVGKLTGRPGICFVTRGPGATNAAHGVHIAAHDSTPMILLIGQVERAMRHREAFQEIDYGQMFGDVAKWVVEVNEASRLPEFLARAFRIAMQGRPGPVVMSLPEDMLVEKAAVADAPYVEPADSAPSPADLSRFAGLLAEARRPIAILGGSRWSEKASADFAAFAERTGLPVATSFRRAHLFPAEHPNYAGDLGIGPNPKLFERVKEADLILLLGGRLAEMPSGGYTLLDVPTPRQRLVHVHPGAEELGRVYQPALAIQASPTAFVEALAGTALNVGPAAQQAGATHQEYLDFSGTPLKVPGAFQYAEAMVWLRERLGPDAIICNGAGNYAAWIHRFYRFRRFATQLAPVSGSMGYGVPAAVMAKRLYPERNVVAFAGDGCFLMNGQEFATAVQHGIAVIVVVVDNSMYGTIRMHQESRYPDRVSATDLSNPDFAALARAYGGHGETVETTEEFAHAFERALAAKKAAIIHCRLDPEAITPAKTLTQLRASKVSN